MTKEDLSEMLAERTGDTVVHSKVMIDGLLDVIIDALSKGRNIYLRGFGSFRVVKRKAKPCRNISTGEAMVMPAHKTVKFSLGKELKERVV